MKRIIIAIGLLVAVCACVGAYGWYALRMKPVTSGTHWLYITGDSVSNPELLAARGEIRETDADRLAGEYHGIIMLGYFTGDTGRMTRDLTAFYNRVFTDKGAGRQ